MIEVTDEMCEMAEQMLALRGFRIDRQTFEKVYRTLRTMEPVPPDLRNRQAPPPLKAGDPGMRAEDQAAFGGYGSGIGQSVNPAQQAEVRRHALNGKMEPESGEPTPVSLAPKSGAWEETPDGYRRVGPMAREELRREFPGRAERETGARKLPLGTIITTDIQEANDLIRHWADTAERWGARANCRLDALQALVLVLAGRSPGYPPGDATLTRMIAELENAK